MTTRSALTSDLPRRVPLASLATVSASEGVEPVRDQRFAFLLFCIYAFVVIGRPQDYVPALAPFRIVIVLTVLTGLVTLFSGGAGIGSSLRQPETRLYVFFFLIMCLGIPFSIYRRKSFDAVILSYIANLVFYVLFVAHVNTVSRYKRIVLVLSIAVFLFSVVSLKQGAFVGGRYLTGSEMFDPNDVAFVEVSLLAFPLCVLLGSFAWLSKVLALSSVLMGVVLTLYTGSRGGLLGLLGFLLIFLAIRIPSVKKWHKIALVAALAGTAFATAGKINVDRYLTLTDLGDDYNLSDEFGRKQLWSRGFQLFLENPVTGVGVSGFGEAIGTMRAHELAVPKWQDPHNSYIQVLTETGLFGAVAFVALVVMCGRTLNRYRRAAPALAEHGLGAAGPLLLAGFVGLLVSAAFLTQAYSVLFTMFFAAGVSLRRVARTEGALPDTPDTDTLRTLHPAC